MHIRLIDAVSLACAQPLPADDRVFAGVLAGMLQTVRRWRHSEPDALPVLLWDTPSVRRRELLPSYRDGRSLSKDQRQLTDVCLQNRVMLERAFAAIPIAQLGHPDMEARDLAYAVSRELSVQGHLISLSTSDRAWDQCIRSRVSLEPLRKSAQGLDEYIFKKITGCASPQAFADARALAGVPGDSVPGIAGITDARAKELLSKWGSMAAFWKAAEDPFFTHFDLLPASLPEGRTMFLRNKAIVDLSAQPPPDIAKAELLCGEFSDIDLFEVFVDVGLPALCSGFELFTRPFAKPLTKEQVSMLARVVRSMPKSYM